MADLIERAKAALEGATPAPWTVDEEDCASWGKNFSILHNGNNMIDVAEMVRTEEDAALIALTPDMAKALIAAEELASEVELYRDMVSEFGLLDKALARFRAAIGG